MKVYRVVPDVSRFEKLFPDDDKVWETGLLTFDGTPKGATWQPPKVFVLEPKLSKGNFRAFAAGALVADATACLALENLDEFAELLPLPYGGDILQVMNVTGCFNVLDEEKTRWVYGQSTGKPIRIAKYVFKSSRFTEVPLFKIPETCRGEILTIEGLKDPEDEFKFNVESKGLTGLLFKELWDSERPGQ